MDNVHAACITESQAGDYIYIFKGLGLVHKQHLISQTVKWSDDCQTHHMHACHADQPAARKLPKATERFSGQQLQEEHADWTTPPLPLSAAATGRSHRLHSLHRGHVQVTNVNRQVCASSRPWPDRILTCVLQCWALLSLWVACFQCANYTDTITRSAAQSPGTAAQSSGTNMVICTAIRVKIMKKL